MTTSIPRLDLDAGDSTATGSSYLTTFVENGTGIRIANTDATIMNPIGSVTSLTVSLANAQSGDQLLIDGSTATSGTVSGGISYAVTGSTITFTGAASSASYQAALGAVTFRNTSERPATVDRTINVSFANSTFSSNVAVSTIKVIEVNDLPIAVNDGPLTTAEDTAITNIAVLTNDTDIDDKPVPGTTFNNVVVTAASAPNGTVTINANGTLNYTPNLNYNGTDTISYTISDGRGGTSSAIVPITITAVNDAPTPVGVLPPRSNVDAASGISVATASAFADVDGPALTYSAAGLPNGLSINSSTGVITGTIDRSASQVAGGVYTVGVTASDGSLSTTQSFTWTITNPPPVAVNDAALVVNEDTAGTTVNVLANDRDPDGDPLTLVSASAGKGSVVVNANGTISYTPNANYNGSDTITYTISDGQGGTATATVAVTVVAVNDAPVRVGSLPPQSNVDAQAGIVVATAGGFSDIDDATLRYAATGLPAGLSINTATGVISGTIDRSASQGGSGGVYSVTVTATDAGGLATTQTFTWSVTNPAPTAANDSASTSEDTPVTINVLANDSDPDRDPLSVVSASAANGTVTINSNGTLLYVPNANFNGADTITYTISDGQGGSSTATVTVAVAAVNDAPVAVGALPPQANLDAQSGIAVPTAGAFSDVDNSTLSYAATGLPAGLTINATTGVISGTIDRSASQSGSGGVYAVTVTATDAGGLSANQKFAWTITNPAPIAQNDAVTISEDTSVTVNVLANDRDPDIDPLTVVSAIASVGSAVISGNQIQYTPPTNFNGTATITYRISDGQGGTATATLTVTVTPVNDAPTATPIAPRSVNDGAAVSVPVAGNFSDVDGNALSFSATGLPPGLSIDPVTGVISGTVSNAASQTNAGVYTATISVSDGNGGTVSQTISFTVSNPPPVATNDSVSTSEDTPVRIDVLANDSDPDRDPLTVITAGAGNGTVTINPDGSLRYVPNADFNGTDTITYTISDGQGGTSTATVTVTVATVNDPPVVSGSIGNQTNLDSQAISLPVGGAFADPEGDALAFTAVGLPAGLTINAATGVISGTIDHSASQSNGGVYSVTVTANDGKGGSVSQTFTWAVTNPAPVATDDSASVNEDTSVRIPVLANDPDADGDPLTVTAASAGNGTVTINADGSLLYTPNPNFNGSDTIIYRITDREGGFSTASVTVTVNPVNDAPVTSGIPPQNGDDGTNVSISIASSFGDPDGDKLTFTATNLPPTLTLDPVTGVISGALESGTAAKGPYVVTVTATDPSGASVTTTFLYTVQNFPPSAVNDDVSTPEDVPVTIAVLTNDSDPNRDPLTITSASATNGTVVVNRDGTLTFTPTPDFNGTAVVSYTITDGNGGFSTATATITVGPVNDAPDAVTIPPLANQDSQSTSVNVGDFFSDRDGDTLVFSAAGLPSGIGIDPATGILSGTLAANASQGGAGGVYSVTVTATDPSGLTVSRTFSWTIVNPAPTATNDTATTAEDTAVAVVVLTNDTDPDADPLTVTSATALHGTVAIGANGVLTYTPDANYNGTDTITYAISDGNGGSSTAAVAVTVTPVNDAPVAANDSTTTNEDVPVTFAVLPNDSDVDGDTLVVSAATSPNGTVTINADGTLTFTPAANFNGATTISYTISDGNGGSSTATVAVTVAAVNDAPVANPSTGTTAEDTPVDLPVLANDTDVDGNALTVTSASAANGTVVVLANGTVRYTPNANFNGTDTVTYTISDGQGGFSTSTVTVTVTPVNDAPTATPIAPQTGADGSTIRVPVAGSFTDVDGNTLSFSATGLPAGLSIDPATGVISGTIDRSASQVGGGTYSVVVTASDGNGGTVSTTFSWTVTNPAPTATNDSATTPEDTPVTVAVLANDSDPDRDPLTVVSATSPDGVATINPDGTITFTPAANFNGVATVTYSISDGQGGTSTATLRITVDPVNDAPVVKTPLANVTQADGSAFSLPVAGAFSDPDGNTLSFAAAGLPAELAIDPATGVISGTIDRSASQVGGGVYTVTITASDGNGGTVATTFSFTVTNPAPSATNDSATTAEDTPVTITVLGNDSDPDADPLRITSATSPDGVVTINPDGTLSFVPAANFNGATTISYTISDGQGGVASATVAVTVTAVNDAPVVGTPLPNVDKADGAPVNLATAGSFSDVDGNTLTFSAAGLPAGLAINPTSGVISGTLDRSASQLNGGVYSVTVTANDGAGGTTSSTFTFRASNPAPTAVNDSATTREDTPVTIAVLANDTDPDGDPLQISSAYSPDGTVVINADRTITFLPAANFNGTTTITYAISDGQGGTSTAIVTVTVSPVNDAPVVDTPLPNQSDLDGTLVSVATAGNFSDLDRDTLTFSAAGLPAGLTIDPATGVISGTLAANASQLGGGIYRVSVTANDGAGGSATSTFVWMIANPPPVAANDAITLNEDPATAVTIAVLANDSDPDRDALTVTSAIAQHGIVTINANGTLSYTPNPNYNGSDTITYSISDGQGGIATATVAVTVNPVNDAPVSAGLQGLFSVDSGSVSFPVGPAFSDLEGDTLVFSVSGLPAGLTIDPATGTISGTLAANASTGGPNANGVYTVFVTAADGNGGTVTSSFTWTVKNVAPQANNDAATTAEDTPVTLNVLFNDTDPNLDPLTPTLLSATHGTAAFNNDGTLTFTPDADFNGIATATYRVSDGKGGFSTAVATITVTPTNDAPNARPFPDRSNIDGASVSLATSGFFSDRDGDVLRYTAASLPDGLSIDPATGVISGTIDRSASQVAGGVYSVSVTATDPGGLAITQTFVWVVTNPAPTATNDTASTAEDTAVTVTVLTNDSDPDLDPLSVTQASAGNGTVTINPDGTLTYVPVANFNGTDTITYSISDGQGGTSTATVAVTVTPINDAPTAAALPARSNVDAAAVSVPVAVAFSDVDGNALNYTATGLPSGLSIDPNTGVIAGTIDKAASQGGVGGVYGVTVFARDGNGGTVSTSFDWVITNLAPVAANDTAATTEDVPVTISVLTNDRDPDGDSLAVVSARAANGAVTINIDGTLTYVPAANFNGSDTITYTISDGQGGLSTATVTITVAAANDAPTVAALAPQVNADGASVTLPTAASFSDVDGDTLTYSAANLPVGLTMDAATGVISGTIDRSASQGGTGGVYTVTVTASDGAGGTVSTSFNWTVTNPAPRAANDSASTTEDVPVTIAVLTNDSDPDGDRLSVATAAADNGTVVINPNGTLTYTPRADFNGTDTITYTISDGNGGFSTATVALTVVPANDPPVAVADTAATNEDTPVTLAVLLNDRDIDGNPLTVTTANSPDGSVVINSDGTITFTPNADFNGTAKITYTISDGAGGTASATATVIVAPVNDPPIATNDTATTNEDTPVTVSVLANDRDVDADTLTVTSASSPDGRVTLNANGTITFTPNADFNGVATVAYAISDGKGGTASATVAITVTPVNDPPVANPSNATTAEDTPVIVAVLANDSDVDGNPLTVTAASAANGTVAILPDGTVRYTPNPDFNGSDTITYTISDGQGGFATSSVAVSVTPVNDPPVATNDTATTAEDQPVTIPVLANDTDREGGQLIVTSASSPDGTVKINPDGTITFTPNANFNGATSITYTIRDDAGATATATVAVTVTPVNDAPIANPSSATAVEDTAVVVPVLANDSDPDGNPLTVVSATAPHGTVTINADGTVTYLPDADFNGTDTITYTISDGNGGVATSTVAITVAPVNDAPVAANDAATTQEDTPVTLAVLLNDSDVDGNPLTIIAATSAQGATTINPDGTIGFTPAANFTGVATLTYTISDGSGGTATATATITVLPVNDPPIAAADQAVTNEDTPVVIAVLGNDRDVEGDPLSLVRATATNGTVTILPDGTARYTPNPDFNGSDTITYTISDGQGGFATSTVDVTVTAVNDPPVAVADTATTNEDTPVTLAVLLNDRDIDGNPLTVTTATSPDGSVVINSDGTITFTPNADFNGTATITYTISDGAGGTASATATVIVAPVNDPPVATNDTATTNEDTPVTVSVLANDRDVDGNPLTVTAASSPDGTVVINRDGTITFTPKADFNGTATIAYTISDGSGGTASATATVIVAPVNDPPVAVADRAATNEGVPVVINVLSNDRDVEGDRLSVVGATAPNGTVTILPDGTVRYTPNPGFFGTDTLTYTISDGKGGFATSTAAVVVTRVNTPPVDGDEAIDAIGGVIYSIPVLANASDANADSVSLFSATADVGTVTINPDGTLAYVAPIGFQGIATIRYVVSDGRGGFDVSVATVRVTQASADVNALLGLYPQPGIPDGVRMDGVRDQSRDFITIPLIIGDTVNAFRSLHGTPDLGGDRPLLTAVNGISWLGGMADRGHATMNAVNDTIRYLDRVQNLRDPVDQMFDPRWDDFAPKALTGFSVRHLATGNDQVMIESIVRDRVIYIEMRDVGPDNASRITEYRLRMRDGSRLPEWVTMDQRGLAIVERPANAEELHLVVRAIRGDGHTIDIPVIVQGATGEIQLDVPIADKQIGAAEPLSRTLLAARTASQREAATLADAFSDHAQGMTQ